MEEKYEEMRGCYPASVCSACVFSPGIDDILQKWKVVCKVSTEGTRIDPLHICGHVKDGRISIEELLCFIKGWSESNDNPDALYFFMKKMIEGDPECRTTISERLLELHKEILK